jgi:hypothetical protein
MVMVATLSFLTALSLMLSVGAASYISRGAVRRGAGLLATAIILAATTIFAIYPSLRLTDGGADDAFRVAEFEQLKADRDRLLADVNQKARDSEALTKTSAFFSKLHKERLTRIAEEIHNVKDLVLGPQSGLVALSESADVTLTSFVEGPAGFESILADLKRLKSLRARGLEDRPTPTLAVVGPSRGIESGTTGMIVDAPSPASAAASVDQAKTKEAALLATASEPDTISTLRKALDLKMSTNTYKIEALAETEYVDGRSGRYYLVELRGAKTGQRFTFDSGKYTFQGQRSDYKASFNSFAGDVLKQLEGQSKFEMFVRGSADAQAYSGQLEPGFEYRKITYLPSVGRGKYLANAATVAVAGTVKNTDLPNLRGEYLRGYLAELYPTKPAVLLEGQVTKKDNPAARNTELILYVAW